MAKAVKAARARSIEDEADVAGLQIEKQSGG